jgi:hypothetical protein
VSGRAHGRHQPLGGHLDPEDALDAVAGTGTLGAGTDGGGRQGTPSATMNVGLALDASAHVVDRFESVLGHRAVAKHPALPPAGAVRLVTLARKKHLVLNAPCKSLLVTLQPKNAAISANSLIQNDSGLPQGPVRRAR